jgi:hypothetical protein
MAKHTIKVQKAIKGVLNGKQAVTVFSGSQRFTTHMNTLKVLGVNGHTELIGRTMSIETFEVGDKLLDGSIYEGRDGSNLVKEINSISEAPLNLLIAQQVAASLSASILAGIGNTAAPQQQEELAKDTPLLQDETPAAATSTETPAESLAENPAEVLNENLPA